MLLYSFRMTELSLLEFIAVGLVVSMVIAVFVACDWYPGLGLTGAWQGLGVAIWVPLIVMLIVWTIVWGFADLWCQPLERKLAPLGERLKHYIALKLYRPRHAG